MIAMFVLDTPENRPVVDVADAAVNTTIDKVGPYFRISSPVEIVIDRRATGCRHAVWYSSVAGLADAKIVQWDKDQIRVASR